MQADVPTEPVRPVVSNTPKALKYGSSQVMGAMAWSEVRPYPPTNQSTFQHGGNDTVRFHISSSQFLDLKKHYLRFTFKNTTNVAGLPVHLDGGAGGAIEQIRVLAEHGGAELEKLEGYGLINVIRQQYMSGCSELEEKRAHEGACGPSSVPIWDPYSTSSLPRDRSAALNAGYNVFKCVKLGKDQFREFRVKLDALGFMNPTMGKYLPKNSPFRIDIQFAPAARFMFDQKKAKVHVVDHWGHQAGVAVSHTEGANFRSHAPYTSSVDGSWYTVEKHGFANADTDTFWVVCPIAGDNDAERGNMNATNTRPAGTNLVPFGSNLSIEEEAKLNSTTQPNQFKFAAATHTSTGTIDGMCPPTIVYSGTAQATMAYEITNVFLDIPEVRVDSPSFDALSAAVDRDGLMWTGITWRRRVIALTATTGEESFSINEPANVCKGVVGVVRKTDDIDNANRAGLSNHSIQYLKKWQIAAGQVKYPYNPTTIKRGSGDKEVPLPGASPFRDDGDAIVDFSDAYIAAQRLFGDPRKINVGIEKFAQTARNGGAGVMAVSFKPHDEEDHILMGLNTKEHTSIVLTLTKQHGEYDLDTATGSARAESTFGNASKVGRLDLYFMCVIMFNRAGAEPGAPVMIESSV